MVIVIWLNIDSFLNKGRLQSDPVAILNPIRLFNIQPKAAIFFFLSSELFLFIFLIHITEVDSLPHKQIGPACYMFQK